MLVPNDGKKVYQPDSHNHHGEFEAAMNACQLSTSSSRVQPLALLLAAACMCVPTLSHWSLVEPMASACSFKFCDVM